MKSKEQKIILENLFSSGDVYSRCAGILAGEYFDPEFRNVVLFVNDYFSKYSTLPTFELLNAKFDLNLVSRETKLTRDVIEYTCTEVETFCKERAMFQAVQTSLDDIAEGNLGAMMERIKKAFEISLQRDIGIDIYDDPERRLRSLLETEINYSTGIKGLDNYLGGGLARKQLTMFSANSGGGKSIMLTNLGVNYSVLQSMHVLLVSLELPQDMIFLRTSYIMSGVDTHEWKDKISTIASAINNIKKESDAGSFLVKRLPKGSTANDIRSLVKQYYLEHGHYPDVLITDYLDEMNPNGGTKNLQGHEQDRLKAAELYEVVVEIDAIGITASQQNRDALTDAAPTQGVIAGGISKVNALDNYISIYMNPAMRIRGEMNIYFLKTRSSDGVGKSTILHFDSTCLRITDNDGSSKSVANALKKRKKRLEESANANGIIEQAIDLPGIENDGTLNTPSIVDKFIQKVEDESESAKVVKGEKSDRIPKDVSKLAEGKKTNRLTGPPAPTIIEAIGTLPEPEHKKDKKEIQRELNELDDTVLEKYFTVV